ncbi:MAG TPA: type IV secretory system conjugative DNA transfer family protein [Verrucomicrobiae bacterium]|nr:type IV secretory system conjugative DNA transfer family protein [Verrucomicrobiae bacterium]
MTHVLIVGMTESGKTTLAKRICRSFRSKGIKTIVLDPLHDPGWEADLQTADQYEFMETARLSRQCALFIDESGEMIGRYNDAMFWLATRARHYGHKSHFITQRAAQLSKTVRDQCSSLFLFCVSMDDAKVMANEFNRPELREANTLLRFQCFFVSRFGPVQRLNVNRNERA